MADPTSSISGLTSGIDFKALVDQIITLDRRPAVRLEARVAANAKRKTALGDVQAALGALRTAADALKAGTPLDAQSVTAAGTDASGRALVVATAGAGAAPGTYQLVVERLAAGQKTVGAAGVSSTAALGASGTFAVNGQNVDVTAADTLAGVRDKVNALAATTGVRASVVTGGANDARLVLTSTGTGAASAFTVADVTGTVAGAALGITGPPAQAAQDARVVVDGVPVERASNTVTDALPGVTLTLSAADPARTATLTVERFKAATTEAFKGFVDAYNKARALVTQQGAAGAALAGDSMLRTVAGALSTQVLGSDAALPADMTALGAAGITVQKDGTLALDAARLDAASTTRPDALRAMLASRMGAMSDYLAGVAAPLTGLIDQRGSAVDEQSARMQARVADVDARLEKKRTALLAQYAKFEASLGKLKALGAAMSSQFAGLNKSGN